MTSGKVHGRWPGRRVFRGRPGLEEPFASAEEVRSSGCSSTAPFRCRVRAQFHSLSARLGLGPRAAPSRHSGCRSFSQVTGRKFSCPPPLLGRPCEHSRLLSFFLPGWACKASRHLYAFGLKPWWEVWRPLLAGLLFADCIFPGLDF